MELTFDTNVVESKLVFKMQACDLFIEGTILDTHIIILSGI